MKKFKLGKIAAFLLSVCLVLGGVIVLPVQAAAPRVSGGDGGQDAKGASGSAGTVRDLDAISTRKVTDNGLGPVLELNMGASALGNPAQDEALTEWTGTKVYFGKKLQDGDGIWRVLDNNSLILHSEQSYGSYSTQEEALGNEDVQMEQYFSKEGSAVKEANYDQASAEIEWVLTEGESADQAPTFIHKQVQRKKLYFPDMAAAGNAAYGYVNDATRKIRDMGWWTRSLQMEGASDKGNGAAIGPDGKYVKVNDTDAIEYEYLPVLELDSQKIAFTTPATWKKPESVEKIEEYTGDDVWKFTLFGTEEKLGAIIPCEPDSDRRWHYKADSNITVHHAPVGKVWTSGKQVSALFTTGEGASEVPVYYGKISDDVNATQTDIQLSGKIEPGQYQLYVFAEMVNLGFAADYASGLGEAIPVTIYDEVKIDTLPTATPITYGNSLGQATLNGGRAVNARTNEVVSGTFSWAEPEYTPNANGSPQEFEIIFEPVSPYYIAVSEVKKASVQVNQAPQAPDYPSGLAANGLEADYSRKTVKETENLLPAGWKWTDADAETPLEVGTPVVAAAFYENHGGNYIQYEAQISITRQACTHTYTSQVTKEPTTQEEGVRTYTCSVCGHSYTEAIPKLEAPEPPQPETPPAGNKDEHTHYYNNTKTLKWLGCEQQGEVEHSCGCGDSYVVVTPALGHDYKTEITKQATASAEGVKTYTCNRCGHSYTEAIPRLAGDGNGSDTGSSGTTGSTGNTNQTTPHIKGNSRIKGWTDLNKHIEKAKDGETIQIDMEDSAVLPGKTLKALRGRNITMILDMGEDVQWHINGTDITAEAPKDIDLKVKKDSNVIPAEIAESAASGKDTVQITLAREDAAGMKAELQMLLDSQKAGYYANLFAYDEDAKTLTYVDSPRMDGKGAAVLPTWEAEHYLVVLDTAPMDGIETEETPEAPTEEETFPTETLPEAVGEEKPGEDGVPVVIIIAGVAAVLALGALGFVAFRVQKGKGLEEEQ